MPLEEALREPERRILLKALKANNWNRQKTAEQLDINRTTLYKKLKALGLENDDERRGSGCPKLGSASPKRQAAGRGQRTSYRTDWNDPDGIRTHVSTVKGWCPGPG